MLSIQSPVTLSGCRNGLNLFSEKTKAKMYVVAGLISFVYSVVSIAYFKSSGSQMSGVNQLMTFTAGASGNMLMIHGLIKHVETE